MYHEFLGIFRYLLHITYVWHQHNNTTTCVYIELRHFFQIIIGINVFGVRTSELVTNNSCLKNWTERLNNEVYSFQQLNRSFVCLDIIQLDTWNDLRKWNDWYHKCWSRVTAQYETWCTTHWDAFTLKCQFY